MSRHRSTSVRRCGFSARGLAAVAGGAISLAAASSATGAAYVWGSAIGGSWGTQANWSPVGVPQAAGDTASILATGAAYTVTLNISPTLDAFTMNSADATLAINGQTMTVSGASTITSGTVNMRNTAWVGAGLLTNSGSMTVEGNSTIANLANGGALTVQGVPGFHCLLTVNNPFTNSGTMTFTSTTLANANLAVGGAGTFTNLAGGTVNVLAGASGQRSFNANVVNQGTFNVNAAASLDRASGQHSNSGAMTIAAGNSLTVNGNSQKFTQSGGTLQVDGELAVNSATFRLEGGAITGAGLVRLTNSRLEMGGNGTGTVVTRGNGTMAGSIVSGQTVIVRGEPGFNTGITTDGAFSNIGTLSFTSTTNATANMTVGGSGTLSNFGSLNILAGAGGGRSYDWNLANQGAGSVEVDADASFTGAGRTHTTAGLFHVATSRTLTINGNSQTFTVTGGTLDVDGLLDVVSATFHFNGGTITGDGTARVTNGRLQMGNGGAGMIVTRGTGTMLGSIKNAQNVTVRGEPGFNTSITADDSFANAGSLTFTSTTNAAANMAINKGGTLTNNGAINVLAGAGGGRSYNWNLANTAAGSVTIDADADFTGISRTHSTAGQFTIPSGRSLTINGNNQTFALTGGTLNVAGLLDAASSTLTLNGGAITGAGTVRTTNGRLSMGPNNTTGTAVVRGTATMGGSIGPGLNVIVRGEPSFNTNVTADGSFNNAGSLSFTSTTNASANLTIANNGTLTSTGNVNILPGAGGSRMFNWNFANDTGGTVSVEATSVFAGTSKTQSNDGTFNVTSTGALTVSGNGQTFSQNAGSLNVDGLFDVEGATFAFNGGSITGSGTTRVTNGRLTLGVLPGGSGTVVHRGTGSMAGNIRSSTTVLVRGEPSLNTNITADDSFSNAGNLTFTSTTFASSNMTVNGGGTLTNTGAIDFLAGSGGQRQYNWNLANAITGNVTVNAETVFSGTSRTHTNSGTFQVADARSLTVNGGGQTFTQAAGSLTVGAGGVFDVSGATFNFNGGTIGGPGTTRVTNGRLVHGPAGTGTVVHRGGGTMGGDIPSGHRTIIRGEPSLNTNIAADDSFSNAGILDFTSTTFAQANLTVNNGRILTNTGTINILPGSGGQRAISAIMNNSGLIVNEATASWGATSANHVNSAGTIRLTANSLTITGSTFTNQNEASVQGNATIDVTAMGVTGLANNANLDPGVGFASNDAASIGALRIQGNLTQQPQGALRVNLAGLTSNLIDLLTVSGTASLAGVVEVGLAPGYLPNIGDSFRVMNYASKTGTFAAVNTLLGNTGVSFEAQYSATFMTLVVTAIPSPGATSMLALAGLTVVRRRR